MPSTSTPARLSRSPCGAVGIRSYVAEPARGRRDWSEQPEAQAPVYRNRRRIRGQRGRRLLRRRGEYVERAFAHIYVTGGMRRTHLRGHTNILKRVLIHAGGFNLGLVILEFSPAIWNAGFVKRPGHIFPLVTLDKGH